MHFSNFQQICQEKISGKFNAICQHQTLASFASHHKYLVQISIGCWSPSTKISSLLGLSKAVAQQLKAILNLKKIYNIII